MNKETDSTSIANHPILSDTQVVGLPNNPESNKSRELKHDKVMSDMDYFQSRVITEWSDSVSNDDENDNDNDDDDKDNHCHGSEREEDCGNNPCERNLSSGAQELDLEGQEDTFGEDVANNKFQVSATEDKKQVSESCRLFSRNLSYTTTEEELEEHFSQFGGVSHVHLVIDKETKQSKGITYINFTVPDFAARGDYYMLCQLYQDVQSMKRTMFPRTKEQKLPNNEEKKRGKQLKLVEIPEHGIACSCALIQL